MMRREDLEPIAALLRDKDIIVLSDEIYAELTYGGERHVSIASLPGMKERTVVVNGFSKAYAMTGWRIGYMIAPPAVAKLASSYQGHSTSNACSISQYATLAAMRGPQEDLEKMVAIFEQRAKLIYRLINEIPGVSCRMPASPPLGWIQGQSHCRVTVQCRRALWQEIPRAEGFGFCAVL